MINRVQRERGQSGFSMAEILVVLAVVAIMVAVSIPFIANYRRLYRSDEQSMQILDTMREASQLALTRRRTVRFEIDLTDNVLLLIDERAVGQHIVVKKLPLYALRELRYDVVPNGVTRPNPPNYNDAVFATDTLGHLEGTTPVTNHNVFALRFRRDGSVVNSAGTLTSATIYVFPPASYGSSTPRNIREVRAITIFGGTGAVRYWKHNGATFGAA